MRALGQPGPPGRARRRAGCALPRLRHAGKGLGYWSLFIILKAKFLLLQQCWQGSGLNSDVAQDLAPT